MSFSEKKMLVVIGPQGYGRDVGYSITLEKLPDEIEKISATAIRELWKKEKLKMS